MRRKAGLGEGKLGCILWLLVLALAGLIAYRAIPVKLASTQLYDYMDEQARFGSRTSSNVLKARILKRAKELDLPVTKKDITVTKAGGLIRMRCAFTAPVNILGYVYDWEFNLEVDRQIFIF
ncbi:MAG: hypothetical protein ACE5EG_00990 [Thermoanaerobaculia bacterium]